MFTVIVEVTVFRVVPFCQKAACPTIPTSPEPAWKEAGTLDFNALCTETKSQTKAFALLGGISVEGLTLWRKSVNWHLKVGLIMITTVPLLKKVFLEPYKFV